MAAGQSGSALHGVRHVVHLILADLAHRPYRYNQIQSEQLLPVIECIQRIRYLNLKLFLTQQRCKNVRYLPGLMSVPASPYDQRFFIGQLSFVIVLSSV